MPNLCASPSMRLSVTKDEASGFQPGSQGLSQSYLCKPSCHNSVALSAFEGPFTTHHGFGTSGSPGKAYEKCIIISFITTEHVRHGTSREFPAPPTGTWGLEGKWRPCKSFPLGRQRWCSKEAALSLTNSHYWACATPLHLPTSPPSPASPHSPHLPPTPAHSHPLTPPFARSLPSAPLKQVLMPLSNLTWGLRIFSTFSQL